jgi:hypothetical protein
LKSVAAANIYRWLSRNWGKKKAEKSEGRGPQRGVIGDELTDGRKKTLLFFLSLLNDFTKCTGGKEDESKKNPFHSFKKKMSLIVSIRSLCCM